MAVCDAHMFPGYLTTVLTQLFFPKPPTTFLTCFCRGERRKYAGKKSRLHRGSNSQPLDHESHTLTTELPVRGFLKIWAVTYNSEKTKFCWCVNHFQSKFMVLMRLRYKSFENTVKKEEIAHIEQIFSFSHSVFYLSLKTFCHFHQILYCRLQALPVWKTLKFVIWERVKGLTHEVCLTIVTVWSSIYIICLTLNQMTNFWVGPNWKHLQTTYWMLL